MKSPLQLKMFSHCKTKGRFNRFKYHQDCIRRNNNMQYRNANQNEFIFFRESSPKDNKPTEQNGSIPLSSIEEVKFWIPLNEVMLP